MKTHVEFIAPDEKAAAKLQEALLLCNCTSVVVLTDNDPACLVLANATISWMRIEGDNIKDSREAGEDS